MFMGTCIDIPPDAEDTFGMLTVGDDSPGKTKNIAEKKKRLETNMFFMFHLLSLGKE